MARTRSSLEAEKWISMLSQDSPTRHVAPAKQRRKVTADTEKQKLENLTKDELKQMLGRREARLQEAQARVAKLEGQIAKIKQALVGQD